MKSLKNITIQGKLLILYMSVTGLVLAIAFTIITSLNLQSVEKNIVSGLGVVAEIVADSSAAPLAFSDIESAYGNLRSLKSHQSIVYACIRTTENNIFSEYNVDVKKTFECDEYSETENTKILSDYVDVFKLVFLDDQPIGRLQIKASLSDITEGAIKSGQVSIIMFVGLMLVMALIKNE